MRYRNGTLDEHTNMRMDHDDRYTGWSYPYERDMYYRAYDEGRGHLGRFYDHEPFAWMQRSWPDRYGYESSGRMPMSYRDDHRFGYQGAGEWAPPYGYSTRGYLGRDDRWDRWDRWSHEMNPGHPMAGEMWNGAMRGGPFMPGSMGNTFMASFRGRGPKGYKRSDERIREDVCDRLTEHPDIDATDFDVKVSSGEVTMTGTVIDRRLKHLAEQLAEHVQGVSEVHNQLRVKRDERPNAVERNGTVEAPREGGRRGVAQ